MKKEDLVENYNEISGENTETHKHETTEENESAGQENTFECQIE